jgi:endonuclease/exonuclease/phosphatase family metal-dependent hydrolase
VLAGDFNSNAEVGPEYTGTAQEIVRAGFTDAWEAAHPRNPGYTWPLFGEDQNSGPTTPNERIDLVFVAGTLPGQTPTVLSAVRTGAAPPFASDHAGVSVKVDLRNIRNGD